METRESRYAKLRAEIEMMNEDDSSSKSKSSKVVGEILKDSKVSKKKNLSLDDTLKPYEQYEDKEESEVIEKPKLNESKKRLIVYIVIAASVVAALATALIVVGILMIH